MSHLELLVDLERQLKAHDWQYQYSDDGRVYREGRDQRDSIVALGRTLTDAGYGQEYKDLYLSYARAA